MNRKKSVFISIALILSSIAMAGIIFAWLITPPDKFLLTAGDVKISVDGWYDVVTHSNERVFDDTKKLSNSAPNLFEGLTENQFIAFKFQVTNLETRDAMLSIRLSDMFDYMFENLDTYVQNQGVLSASEMLSLYESAEKNNGRLAFAIDDIYYEYEQNGEVVYESGYINSPTDKLFLWKISRGERFIGTEGDALVPSLPSILLPKVVKGENSELRTNVNVYMMLINEQSNSAIDAFRKWLFGDESTVGVAQEYSANLYGFTWSKLIDGTLLDYADYPYYIDNYLEEFVQNEMMSIADDDDEEGSNLNLELKYFEFIAENLPNY